MPKTEGEKKGVCTAFKSEKRKIMAHRDPARFKKIVSQGFLATTCTRGLPDLPSTQPAAQTSKKRNVEFLVQRKGKKRELVGIKLGVSPPRVSFWV